MVSEAAGVVSEAAGVVSEAAGMVSGAAGVVSGAAGVVSRLPERAWGAIDSVYEQRRMGCTADRRCR